jgi:hypothetical protein
MSFVMNGKCAARWNSEDAAELVEEGTLGDGLFERSKTLFKGDDLGKIVLETATK